MKLYEKGVELPSSLGNLGLLAHLEESIQAKLLPDEFPVRLAVTRSDSERYLVEIGVLRGLNDGEGFGQSIFDFRKRHVENTEQFNAVLIIPTGIGAEFGGHAGDGGPIASLAASVCDNLVTHPNVVNASDINELPDNGLYVEGSVISRLLMGTVGVQKVRSNRVLLVIDDHVDKQISEYSINTASSARATLGLDCPLVVKMSDKIKMYSEYSSSCRAVGRIDNIEMLFEVLEDHRSEYDAVALASIIDVPSSYHQDYYKEDMVNPWGGVEAMLTHSVSMKFNVPSAHSPMIESQEMLSLNVGIVDPRKAAEVISVAFLFSVLKGLHKSPKIVTDETSLDHPNVLSVKDISCIVIPDGCIGLPTLAALEQGIPVIAVKENKNLMQNDLTSLPFPSGKLFVVDSYLEAIGVMAALKEGIALGSLRRPLEQTKVITAIKKQLLAKYKEIVEFKSN